ncbi:hypothetical protein LENED_008729 [Lentinula edodes]|uniref:Uncharacterized protein n=1 Tax=Lentinula edodes TaxID=5353 RepID=A0A1Q3EHT9_LENED|nr:hypothetical protein LENED_008729 [Lentinula edodes]
MPIEFGRRYECGRNNTLYRARKQILEKKTSWGIHKDISGIALWDCRNTYQKHIESLPMSTASVVQPEAPPTPGRQNDSLCTEESMTVLNRSTTPSVIRFAEKETVEAKSARLVVEIQRPISKTNINAIASSSEQLSFVSSSNSIQKPELVSSAMTTPIQPTSTTSEGAFTSLKDALMSSISHNNLPENIYLETDLPKHTGTKRSRTNEGGPGRVKRLRRDDEGEELPGSWSLSKVRNDIPVPVTVSAQDTPVQATIEADDEDDEADLIRLFVVSRAGHVLPPPSSSTPTESQLSTRFDDASLSVRNLNTRFVRSKGEPGIKSNSDGEDVRINGGETELSSAVHVTPDQEINHEENATSMDVDHNITSLNSKAEIPLRKGWIFAALDQNIYRSKKIPSSDHPLSQTLPRIRLGCFIPSEAKHSTDGQDPDRPASLTQGGVNLNADEPPPTEGNIDLSGDADLDLDMYPDADDNSQVGIAVLDDGGDDGESEEDAVTEVDLPIDELADDDAHEKQDIASLPSVQIAQTGTPTKFVTSETLSSLEPRRSLRKPVHKPVTLTNTPRRNVGKKAAGLDASVSAANPTTATSITSTPINTGRKKGSLAGRRSSLRKVENQGTKKTRVSTTAPSTSKGKGKAKEDVEMTSSSSSLVGHDLNSNVAGTESISAALNNSFKSTRRKSQTEKVKSVSVSGVPPARSKVYVDIEKTTVAGGPPESTSLKSVKAPSTGHNISTNKSSGNGTPATTSINGSYNPYSHLTTMGPPQQLASQSYFRTPTQTSNIQTIRDSLPSIQALPAQLQTYLLTALATGVPGILPPALGGSYSMQAGTGAGTIGNAGAVGNASVIPNVDSGSGFGIPGPLLAQPSTSVSSSALPAQAPSYNNYAPLQSASVPPMSAAPINHPASFAIPYSPTASLPTHGPGSTAEFSGSSTQKKGKSQKAAKASAKKNKEPSTMPETVNGNSNPDAETMRVGPPRKATRTKTNKVPGMGEKKSEVMDGKAPAFASSSSSAVTNIEAASMASGSGLNRKEGTANEIPVPISGGVDGDGDIDAEGEIDLDIYAPYCVDINNANFQI